MCGAVPGCGQWLGGELLKGSVRVKRSLQEEDGAPQGSNEEELVNKKVRRTNGERLGWGTHDGSQNANNDQQPGEETLEEGETVGKVLLKRSHKKPSGKGESLGRGDAGKYPGDSGNNVVPHDHSVHRRDTNNEGGVGKMWKKHKAHAEKLGRGDALDDSQNSRSPGERAQPVQSPLADAAISPARVSARLAPSLAVFRDQLAAKERELSELYIAQMTVLEETLALKEAERADLEFKLGQLRSDFCYNLSLIDGRDKEIEKLERQVDELTKDVHDREARISDLKVVVAERSDQMANLRTAALSLEAAAADQARKAKRELEVLQASHSDAVRLLREDHDRAVAIHLARCRELERAVEDEKTSHASSLASLTAAHQHAQREMQLAQDATVAQTLRDIEDAREERNRAEAERDGWKTKWEEGEMGRRALEKACKDLRWDLEDERRTRGVEVRELTVAVEMAKQDAKDARDALEETRERFLHESEEVAKAQLADLSQRLQETQSTLVSARSEATLRSREMDDLRKARDDERRRVEEEAKADREVWEAREAELIEQIRILSSATSSARTKLDASEKDAADLRKLLAEARAEAVKRGKMEDEAQRRAEEVNLEWERKYDQLVRRRARDREAYVREVAAQRDRAEARARVAEARVKAVLGGEKLRASMLVPRTGVEEPLHLLPPIAPSPEVGPAPPVTPAPYPHLPSATQHKPRSRASSSDLRGGLASQSVPPPVPVPLQTTDNFLEQTSRDHGLASQNISPSVPVSLKGVDGLQERPTRDHSHDHDPPTVLPSPVHTPDRRSQKLLDAGLPSDSGLNASRAGSVGLGLFDGDGPEGILKELELREKEVLGMDRERDLLENRESGESGQDSGRAWERGGDERLKMEALVRANTALSAMVRDLRRELEEVQMDGREGASANEVLEMQQTITHLETQLQDVQANLLEQRKLVANLRSQLAFHQSQMGPDDQNFLAIFASLESERDRLRVENCRLRDTLRSAVADLRKLSAEREHLVDMCNALRAEIRAWEDGINEEPLEGPPAPDFGTDLLHESGRVRKQLVGGLVGTQIGTTVPNGRGVSPPRRGVGLRRGAGSAGNKIETDNARRLEQRKKGVRNWNDMDEDV
ncbi:hypothetical protein HDU93_002884 [Gonapodya sp. JEL0774]|nr:hypothetical protein HDU93_002884 [Gonapodya sp. JEL0774]